MPSVKPTQYFLCTQALWVSHTKVKSQLYETMTDTVLGGRGIQHTKRQESQTDVDGYYKPEAQANNSQLVFPPCNKAEVCIKLNSLFLFACTLSELSIKS